MRRPGSVNERFFLYFVIEKVSSERGESGHPVSEDYGKPLEEEDAGGEMEVELAAALFIHRWQRGPV